MSQLTTIDHPNTTSLLPPDPSSLQSWNAIISIQITHQSRATELKIPVSKTDSSIHTKVRQALKDANLPLEMEYIAVQAVEEAVEREWEAVREGVMAKSM
jgi:predicted NAD-dependent protein-ADP-ribosyltransferase YbiA (DUF1768 family)